MNFALPPVGEGLIEVELVRWLVQPGDAVKRGQPLMEAMSDKATMEVPAPFAGVITALAAEAGTKIKVGQHVLTYSGEGEAAVPVATGGNSLSVVATAGASGGGPAVAMPTQTAPANGSSKHVAAAPSIRLMARKLGIDLARVRGSGPAGRVLIDDLKSFFSPAAAVAPKPAPDAGVRMDFGKAGSTVKLAGLRKIIAERMVASKRSIPHYAYVDEVDVTDMVRLRAQLKEPYAAAGVKLTYLAFLVMAAVRALKDVPIVNSTYDEATLSATLHDHYHIGIAVAVTNGLIVPVIKDADQRDLAGIASEIERLGEACRTNKIKAEELKGGTFTVTSVGGIGGLISTPIINAPEVGIMGVGKVIKRPVYDANGNLKPADLQYLSFSFDHRIVDGAVGAAFGNAVAKRLQNPATLLLPEPIRK